MIVEQLNPRMIIQLYKQDIYSFFIFMVFSHLKYSSFWKDTEIRKV